MSWTKVCTLSQLEEESAIGVEVGAEPVCVARSNGQVFALRDVCSHADIPLSEGEVDEGTVECWLHGSRFDLSTGMPDGLPANRPIPTYAVKVEGDDVFVSLNGQ
jgi:3-phenylpropionate/trans-cinnamate dioxygenase ferredoxin subunit